MFAAACGVAPLFAITLDDLSPTALPGKMLELSFEGGDAVPPPTGTWTASFAAAPAKTVTVSGFPGVAGSHNSTWASGAPAFPDSYRYTLSASPAFGGKTATIDLWVSVPGGRFYLTVDGVGSYGGVTLASAPKGPEISLQQPAGKELAAGKSKRDFGRVGKGKSGLAKKFVIRNTGTTALKNIAISKSGAHAADFIVAKPTKTTIPAGGSASFTVTFKPRAVGTRKASIAIRSNDANENPFKLTLTGTGVAK